MTVVILLYIQCRECTTLVYIQFVHIVLRLFPSSVSLCAYEREQSWSEPKAGMGGFHHVQKVTTQSTWITIVGHV